MSPTIAEVDLSAIQHNIAQVRRRVAPARIMAVVKADAYGHGAVRVSRLALDSGCTELGVARIEEGVELRESGIQAPILVFGGMLQEQAQDAVRHDLAATLYTGPALEALETAARGQGRRARAHIKVDTGMGRVGIPWEQAAEFIRRVTASDAIDLEGVYTHFATADERDKAFTRLQLKRFHQVLTACRQHRIPLPRVHAANSGAILDVPEACLDLVRPGVMLYGHYPSTQTTASLVLRPAMTFKTRVLHVKTIEAGTSVSYGRTFIAPRRTRMATLPVGYADGFPRRLSNRGEVLIQGRRCRVIGRVCMDLTLVDVTEAGAVRPGDEAVLFGTQGDDQITVQSLCDLLDAIPYQVTCWVSRRVPRVYVNEPKPSPRPAP